MGIKNLWERTKWFRWIVGVILTLAGLYGGYSVYHFIFGNENINVVGNNNQVAKGNNINQLSVSNSSISGDVNVGSNITKVYDSPSCSDYYPEVIQLLGDSIMSIFKENYSKFHNIKFLMPDGGEAYIPIIKRTETLDIGCCNKIDTECNILKPYRKIIADKDLCLISITRFGRSEMVSDHKNLTDKLLYRTGECVT